MSFLRRVSSLLTAAVLAACSSTTPPPPAAVVDGGEAARRVDGPVDLLERAMALLAAERFDAAAAVAEAFLERFPSDPRVETALFLTAEASYQDGDFERALAGFTRLLEDFPYTRAHAVLPERFFVIGEGLLEHPMERLGGLVLERQPGIDALSRLVVHYPEYPRADDAWLLLGAAHLADGAYDYAVEAYRRLLRTYPDSPLREEAAWREILVQREKWKGPSYDPAPLDEALLAVRRYLREFPEGRRAAEVRALREEIGRDRRCHEAEVEEFYGLRK